jgi:hypothetical protein
MIILIIFQLLCFLNVISAAAPSLKLSHNVVESWEEWIDVTALNIDPKEFSTNTTEYICTQDSYCSDVKNLSVWIGLFEENADLSPIGPQSWACGNPPWLAASPVKWKPLTLETTSVRFLVKSHRRNLKFALFTNGTTYPIHLATSNVIKSTLAHIPRSLHLALGPSSNSMRVSFEVSLFFKPLKI